MKRTITTFITAVIMCCTACYNSTVTLDPPEDPIADDFYFEGLEQIWDGNPKEIIIVPKPGKSIGYITVFYNGDIFPPSAIGSYSVTFNITAAPGFYAAEDLSAGILEIVPFGKAATPTIDPPQGIYTVTQQVVISTETAGAVIHFTIDGSTPTVNNAVFKDHIIVDNDMIIKAIAVKEGMIDSDILEAGYIIKPEDPVVGDFIIDGLEQLWDGNPKQVTITPKEGKSTGQITVFYNGNTNPPAAIGSYPITFNVAAAAGFNAAESLSAGVLEIKPYGKAATPVANPEAGEYTETQQVTLTSETAGAAIHYTIDGSTPTVESPEFIGSIIVDSGMTIKAIAVKEGMTDSDILEAVFTINPADPGDPDDPDDPDNPDDPDDPDDPDLIG
ncbi:MAG: chitobiase/beta-hexosaminidase C-terminal domain-containing protein [Treponema sp.]|nr:chitobiase/beta-hexosaminidase C-terminal domain-containing protein [Treponema sp.]